jgi:hypothetical protein
VARSLNEALAAAVEAIKPPADSVQAFCAQLTTSINAACDVYRMTASMPPPGKMKKKAKAYLKVLLAAKQAAESFPHSRDDFRAALEREIWKVGAIANYSVVPHGARQRDMVADVAAIMARNLIDPDPNRHPENRGKDFPAIECPWRRPAMLTYGGHWLSLAALIYESATGVEPEPEMIMKYCREADEVSPRYVLTGLTLQAR